MIVSKSVLKQNNRIDLTSIAAQFGTLVTPALAALIDPHDPRDPIAAQFLPSVAEQDVQLEELADPIGDARHSPVPGIVHHYPDRVLLKLLHACAVHCRYCFRREQIDQPDGMLGPEALARALDYIRNRPEIWEVILTGGDPFVLSDRRLAEIIVALNGIPHVKIIRVHTRVPVADPARITPEFVAALRGRAPVYVMLHANHPRELTEAARAACARLVDAGIPMLSQSVLLHGVNDDAETLGQLMRAFVETRIKPHYLHHGDLARGTAHFRTTLAEGQALTQTLRRDLSGLCQPTYMLDIPGGHGKVPVGATFAHPDGTAWRITDRHGMTHAYRDIVTGRDI